MSLRCNLFGTGFRSILPQRLGSNGVLHRHRCGSRGSFQGTIITTLMSRSTAVNACIPSRHHVRRMLIVYCISIETTLCTLVPRWQSGRRRKSQPGCECDPSVHRKPDGTGLGTDRYISTLSLTQGLAKSSLKSVLSIYSDRHNFTQETQQPTSNRSPNTLEEVPSRLTT